MRLGKRKREEQNRSRLAERRFGEKAGVIPPRTGFGRTDYGPAARLATVVSRSAAWRPLRDICLEAEIKQTSYLGEMTKFYVETKEIEKTITVSSQYFDNKSFENNKCFISISLDDISLLKKK